MTLLKKNINYKILLVDDEDAILKVCGEMISHLGYSVTLAKSGKEALSIYKNTPDFDLLIIDYNIPEMNGIECLNELLKINPEIKTIISSGYNDQNIIDKTLNAGAIDFLGKPYRMNELNEKIKKALKK